MATEPGRLFSTRSLLLYALAFNVVVVCLAEVQRRALVGRIGELIEGQDQDRKNESRQFYAELSEQGKRLSAMHSAMQVLTKNGRFASNRDIESAIVGMVEDGKQIVVRFDDSDIEDRDKGGAILCGPEAQKGYLGAFIAGAEYTLSYNRQTHRWSGSGPVQSDPIDPATSTCRGQTVLYGPEELGAVVLPQESLVLWGGRFKLHGLDVYLSDQKVGRIVAALL